MNKYEPVIGLEVHVELNTKAKMFCKSSATYFGEDPNTHTCPICLGLPGALPYVNKAAIEDCIKIGLALNCQVSEYSLFERKNYFYPDLPKGYQISQYRWPLTVKGWIEIENNDGTKSKIRINRAHQEEDTGKLTHSGSDTLIDYNRSSVPLVEIVTEPDFTEVEQIKDYAQKLQQIFRYLGVSNADMEKGDMRLEANVSVRKLEDETNSHISSGNTKHEKKLPNYRVELKNINSFRFMMAAVEYEIKRQIEAHEKGEKLIQETRGWDEIKKVTFTQRVKEEANDYRYFPEPDLPPMRITKEEVELIKKELPELPSAKCKRFEEEYKLDKKVAKQLTESKQFADYFEDAVKDGIKFKVDPKTIANYIINTKVDIENLLPAEVIKAILEKTSGIVTDESELTKIAQEVIAENPKPVEDYRSGKETIMQFFIGMVQRKTQGKADTAKAKEILEKLLKS